MGTDAAPQPLAQVTAEGSPPIMVVSTTNDPATPYENGVTVESHLANGFLLTHRGARAKAYVYTVREAALAKLMPVRSVADAGKVVRCPN